MGHGTGAAVGGVSSLNFHSHIVQRLDGMMRPPKTEKLFNCEQAEEIKSQTGTGVTIARDTSHARRAVSTVETSRFHSLKGVGGHGNAKYSQSTQTKAAD